MERQPKSLEQSEQGVGVRRGVDRRAGAKSGRVIERGSDFTLLVM